MLKRLLLIPLAILLISGMVLTGCGEAEPTDSTEPVVLRLGDFQPENATGSKVLLWWCGEVEERTEGAVQFEYHWSQALAVMTEQSDAIGGGFIDVGNILSGFQPQKYPIHLCQRIPGPPTDNLLNLNYAYDQLSRSPASKAELEAANVKLMFGFNTSGDYIYTTEEIRSVEDMAGLRIGTSGPYASAFGAWGSQPVMMSSMEMYEAVMRGELDGYNKPLDQGITMSLYEVTPYISFPSIGSSGLAFCMNMDTWNSLSPEVQAIIEDINATAYVEAAAIYTTDDEQWLAQMDEEATKINKVYWEEAEVEARNNIVQFVWQQWAGNLNAEGHPGDQILEEYWNWMIEGPPQ